eukprot:1675557-Amphidinium_carterae.1
MNEERETPTDDSEVMLGNCVAKFETAIKILEPIQKMALSKAHQQPPLDEKVFAWACLFALLKANTNGDKLPKVRPPDYGRLKRLAKPREVCLRDNSDQATTPN